MAEKRKIAVCGAGAWGTAIALHWSRLGHDVRLLPRREEHAAAMRSSGVNADYLPGFPIGSIEVEALQANSLDGAEVAFMACPSYAMGDWARSLGGEARSWESGPLFLSLAKGLEIETGRTPCEILQQELPGAAVGVLSGPTFAGEVAAGKPSAMTLAVARIDDRATAIQEAASGAAMRVYLSDDVRGVELGGCLKNVYAIAAGCCQGLGLGDNASAALLTRALAEMVRVGKAYGAKAETFYGLSGFGDLVATCHGEWSRNRTFGESIAKGGRASEIIAAQKTAVEGYRTAKAFHLQSQSRGLEAPILEQVYRILYDDKPPKAALADLMSRDLKREDC